MEKQKEKKPNGFKNFFKSLGNNFKLLNPLVMMQLKDKVDFSYLKSRKKTIFKTVFSVATFVLITALIYLLFNIVVGLGLFSFLQVLNFRVYLVLMTILFGLSFLSCLVNVTKTLYFAKDNPVLLTLPVTNGMIFSSKLIVCFVYELLKNVTYILPFFIAYGLVMKLPVWFYLWAILSLIFFTIIIVAVCGLLSIPAMLVAILFKKNRVLEIITVIAVIVGGSYLVIKTISMIPENIDLVRDWGKIYWEIQDFLINFENNTIIINYMLQLFTGMSYGSYIFTPFSTRNLLTFVNCFATIVGCLVFVYLLSKPLFLKMASNPFEYRKKVIKHFGKNRKMRPFSSAVVRNSQIIFRTSNLIYSVLATAVILPIAIFLQNKIIAAMDTRILGNYMGIAFNILIILLMTLSSNVAIASTFSKEGNSAYLNKVNPVKYVVPLTGKIVLNAIICVASIIASVVMITIFAKLTVMQTILLALALIMLYLAHLLWSAEIDIMNPQNRLYQTTGDVHKNPNENKSTIIAFILSAVFAFVCFLLMRENVNVVYLKMFFISLILLGVRTYLYLTKIKLYYKEK
ncbi:MAG: hypothetical protein J5689_00555 [Clostridia bacterium]|nr:hypothetical protein [Clostridia bacterium]